MSLCIDRCDGDNIYCVENHIYVNTRDLKSNDEGEYGETVDAFVGVMMM